MRELGTRNEAMNSSPGEVKTDRQTAVPILHLIPREEELCRLRLISREPARQTCGLLPSIVASIEYDAFYIDKIDWYCFGLKKIELRVVTATWRKLKISCHQLLDRSPPFVAFMDHSIVCMLSSEHQAWQDPEFNIAAHENYSGRRIASGIGFVDVHTPYVESHGRGHGQ